MRAILTAAHVTRQLSPPCRVPWQELARGSTGIVKKGLWNNLPVCIKRLLVLSDLELYSPSEEAIQYQLQIFEREVRLLVVGKPFSILVCVWLCVWLCVFVRTFICVCECLCLCLCLHRVCL